MPDTKISALTTATTPLAGTEVLPIVQSSSTKKVTVANLTTGRSVSAASLTATNNITANTGNIIIGTSGKGIDFSANTGTAGMTSELLSSYEEGTFTPVVADADTGGNTATGTFTGRYTKIGRIVHVTLQLANINTTGMTAGNNLIVRGLPFTAVTFNQYPCPIAWANLTTGGNIISGSVLGATASLYLVTSLNSGSNGYIKVSAVNSGACYIAVNVTYQV